MDTDSRRFAGLRNCGANDLKLVVLPALLDPNPIVLVHPLPPHKQGVSEPSQHT